MKKRKYRRDMDERVRRGHAQQLTELELQERASSGVARGWLYWSCDQQVAHSRVCSNSQSVPRTPRKPCV